MIDGGMSTPCGAVAAATPQAAEAGASMLRQGGSAADAACAASFALAVSEPAESGLGGLATILFRSAAGVAEVIDGQSFGPRAATTITVRRRDQTRGIRSVAVPSLVPSLAALHASQGRLPWRRVLEPAIALAAEGYAISSLQRRLIRWTARFWNDGGIEAQTFLTSGRPPRVGTVIRQPLLARTLTRLAECGPEDFTTGSIAREIAADMEARSGLVTLDDLRVAATPPRREPLVMDDDGRTFIAPPPPAGGVQLLLAWRLLKLLRRDLATDESGWHVAMAQSLLTAFRERERWPDHPRDLSPSLAAWLVSEGRAEMLAHRLRRGAEPVDIRDSLDDEGDPESPTSGDTTHLCVRDGEGAIVSMTQSIQSVFGSKVMHPSLGFFYNNHLCACPRESHPYRLGPRSVPQSNATPLIVLGRSGTPILVAGSAGSRRITTSMLTVVSGMLDRGLSPRQALLAPRAHPLLSGRVWAERSLPAAACAELSRRIGDVVTLEDLHYRLGAVHLLAADESGGIVGGADPRRDGLAVVIPSPRSSGARNQ